MGPDPELVDAQRELILDPFDPQIILQAEHDGVHQKIIEAAQKSPVYKYVKLWKLALPHHPEWRTLPMLFYVPPLLPVIASSSGGAYELATDFFSSLESARLPIRYLAHLLAGGNEEIVVAAYRKLMAGRLYKRAQTVGDIPDATVSKAIAEAVTTPEELEAIYYMTSMTGFEERFVVPPFLREMAVEALMDTQTQQEEEGMGYRRPPKRGP